MIRIGFQLDLEAGDAQTELKYQLSIILRHSNNLRLRWLDKFSWDRPLSFLDETFEMFCHHRLCQWFRLSDFWDDVISLSLFFVFVSTSVSDLRWNFWVYISPPSRTRTWNKHRCRSLSQDWKNRWVKPQNLLVDQERDSEQKYRRDRQFQTLQGQLLCLACQSLLRPPWSGLATRIGLRLQVSDPQDNQRRVQEVINHLLRLQNISKNVLIVGFSILINHGCKNILKKKTFCQMSPHYQPWLQRNTKIQENTRC